MPQPLALFGTEEQKRVFLPRCARGEISAFLLTEPDVGSDPARLGAILRAQDDATDSTHLIIVHRRQRRATQLSARRIGERWNQDRAQNRQQNHDDQHLDEGKSAAVRRSVSPE